jgi:hypothetical protein
MFANSKLKDNMKRNFVLDQLKAKGITHSQDGTNIEDLTYDDLKYELVIATFKEIDVESSENKWF